MRALALTALLVGCSATASTSADAPARVVAARTPALSADTPSPQNSKARALRRSETTERIDYELLVPAQAAALPRLRDKLEGDAEVARAKTLAEQTDYARRFPDSAAKTFGLRQDWRIAGQTNQLLSLTGAVNGFTGGAHASAGTVSLLWSRADDCAVILDELFTDKARALAILRSAWCKALAEQRSEKLGSAPPPNSPFGKCPAFSQLTVVPSGTMNGVFTRITVVADPYVAGSWAEGEYRAELLIPKAIIPLVRPRWRPSFPG